MSVAEGAIRSGKTIDHCIIAAMKLETCRDKIHLASGSTIANAKLNIGDCNGYGLEHLFRGRCRWGKYKDNEALYINTQTGEKIVIFAGGGKADSYKRILGNSYGMWIATEINEHYDSDDSRTSFIKVAFGRQVAAQDPCVLWDMNPCQPGHKIYTDYIDVYPQTYVGGYNYEHFTLADNYSITPERRREIESQYVVGSIWYKRDIKGERCLAEGLIFPMYLDAIGKPPEKPCDEECISLDYGTQNPLAALYWKRYGEVWWAVDEYYYSGRKKLVQKTDADYVTDMKRFYLKNHEVKEDFHGEDRDPVVVCIIDPSASSFIAAMRREDIFKVRKGKNDVGDGLRETATALQEGYIKISESCTNWKTEASGYIWDSTKAEDAPVKVDDHLCVTGDTTIMTDKGEIPIRELVGKEGNAWSLNTENRCVELKPFRDVRCTQRKAAVIKITLKDGKVIRCTGNHPVLTERGYVQAKYLKATDKIIEITGTK